jgi:hypothetical protein
MYILKIIEQRKSTTYKVDTNLNKYEFIKIVDKYIYNASDLIDFIVDMTVIGCVLTVIKNDDINIDHIVTLKLL